MTADVEVRNTGNSEHTFFIGYSVEGPNGKFYDNDDKTGKTITLKPNEREWISVSWTVEDDAPTGDYDAVTSVWAESDRDNLQTRLDNERRSNVFEVIEPTKIDALITSFDVDNGKFKQGDTVDAIATVENTGNTEHTFFVGYSVFGPSGDDYDNNDETGQTITLDPGEQKPVSLAWTVEDNVPTGDYDAVTSIWKESDRDNLQTRLDDERRNNAFEVVEPTEIDAQITGFSVGSGEFKQGDTVGATATVENTGNTEHTFFVGYSAIGPNSEYYDNEDETGQTVTLDPGDSRRVSLSWTVQTDSPTGGYDALTSVWKESDRDNLNTRLDRVQRNGAFEVVEPTEISARVTSFDVEGGEFEQGDTVDATATVENTGNTEHTFFVGYSAVGPNSEYYDNDDETGRAVTLDPGDSRRVSLSWTVQGDSPTGGYDALTSVWKESDRDNLNTRLDRTQRNGAFEVVDPTKIDAQITNFDTESGEFKRGESIDATATVENTGNTEHTFFVGYSAIGPNSEYYDNSDDTGQTVTLTPDESQTVSLSWTVQTDSPTGRYGALTSVWKESDQDNLDTRLDRTQRNDAFEVVDPTKIDAQVTDFSVDSGEFKQGDTVDAIATVENTGNTEHTFFVGYSAVGPNSEYYDNEDETGQTVTLDPGDSRRVSLSWTVQTDSPTGGYDALTSVWKESDRDNLNTRLDRSQRNGVFEVVEPTEISAQITNFDVEGGEFEQGDTVDATATVENTGNTEHTFFIGYSAVGPNSEYHDNGDDTGQTVTLDPGDSRRVSLSWTVQSDSPAGGYSALTSVWKESDRENLDTRLDRTQRNSAFEVVDPTKIDAQITGFSVDSGEFKQGDTVDATATVENTGNTEHTFFVGYSAIGPNSESYDNNDDTGQTVTLDPGDSRRVSLSWTVQGDSPTGGYDALTSVWKESDRDNLNTRLDRTQRDSAFEVVEPTEISAQLTSFDVESGEFKRGESIDATATVENTGNTEHTFFVGYSAIGPNSEYYDNSDDTGHTVTLTPDESQTVSLSWTVQGDSPTGGYDALTSVWKESNRDNLDTRLDRTQRNSAFEVVDPTKIDAQVTDFSVDSGEFERGNTVDATATVENTGNTEHTFFVGYSAIGPNSESYDNNDDTGQTVTLDPGDSRRVSLSWTVQSDSPAGGYSALTSVWKESDRDNLDTRLDRTQRNDAFEVVESTEISAQITNFDVESGEFERDESVDATATVENTGNTEHTFFIGYSAIGPNSEYYDNSDDTGQTVTLDPGDSRRVSLNWTVQSDSPTGRYGALISVWKESDRDNLNTRLDRTQRNGAFEVVEPTEISAQITSFDVESGEFKQGESVGATATVENTGNTEHTFSIGYSVITPGGYVYDKKTSTYTSVTLEPDTTRSVALNWTVQDSAPLGEYGAKVIVWSNNEGGNLLTGEVANQTEQNSFNIVQAGTELTVQVSTTEEDPIGDATVSIANGQSASTGMKGEAQFTELENGTYEVTVSRDGYVSKTITVGVESGKRHIREVTLSRPSGRIVSLDGVPEKYQPGKEFTPVVAVRNTGSVETTFELTMSNPSGIEIEGRPNRTITLAPGAETTIKFSAEFYGTNTDRSVQFGLTTIDGRVVDSTSQSIEYTDTVLSVRVLDSTGNPVDGSTVSLLSEKSSVRTDVNGRARLTSLTPGQHVVEATPPRITAGGQTTTVDVTAGKRTDVTIRFDRVGTVSGTILNQKGEAISNAVISINDRRALTNNDGKFQFDARFAAGRSYIIDVTRDGDSLYKQNISIEPGSNEVQITVSTDDSSGGWQLVNNANKGAVLGEVGVQMNVPGSRTLEYHAGWLGLSMVPVLDAPADIRDCLLAPNDNIATNSLDCGGAAASTIGSAGTVLGVVTSPSGAGVAVAGGSLTLDTAEDVTDVVKVVVSASKYVDKGVIKIAELLISKVGDQVSKVVDQVKDADVAAALRKSIDKSRLLGAGFTEDEALTLIRQDVSASAATEAVSSGASTNGVLRLADEGVQINRVSGLLSTRYSGKWSPGNSGSATKNFDGHYRDHADEFGDMTKSQYRQQATELLNKREEVIVVYQKKGNMLVANPETGAVAIGNKAGETQTYFKPDNGVRSYVRTLQNERGAVVVKETE